MVEFDGGICTRVDAVPFGVVVNQSGHRFYDEGEDFWPKRYAIWGRLIAGQPGQLAYSIIDAKSEGLFMPTVYPPEQAETLEALAVKLGIDARSLTATIHDYNAAVVTGAFNHQRLDDARTEGLDINKSHWARTIDEPPFSAWPLRPGITFTYMGVGVNEQARVRMADGQVCDNIYAAGEIMAGNVLGQGYLAGIGMTIGNVFGRIAGREAAKHAR